MALSNIVRQRLQQNFGISTDEYNAAQELADAVDAASNRAFNSAASLGGAASETLTVTGLLATDTILAVSQMTPGGNNTAIIAFDTLANNSLKLYWTANPGAGAVVKVLVKR